MATSNPKFDIKTLSFNANLGISVDNDQPQQSPPELVDQVTSLFGTGGQKVFQFEVSSEDVPEIRKYEYELGMNSIVDAVIPAVTAAPLSASEADIVNNFAGVRTKFNTLSDQEKEDLFVSVLTPIVTAENPWE